MKLAVREAGEGPPVVLLHGLFGQARNLAGVQRALAGGHRTIAMDLRNHGNSPHGFGMGYAALAGDVLETLAGLGVARCGVLGHSMGGKVAMYLALSAPAVVTRVLVGDIAPVRYASAFEVFANAMRGLDLDAVATRAQADAALAGGVADAGVRAFLLQNLVLGPARWKCGLEEIAAGLGDVLDWPWAGGMYEGPALFVAGGRSAYIGAEARGVIGDLFPDARVVTLENAGHWLHADEPDIFGDIVSNFFS